ncbi:MAG: TatD family hydrolase [Gemmatimonadaceae bacterium]|nr:TatD family hydrolase [Gemmatimonadaceae bacterium]
MSSKDEVHVRGFADSHVHLASSAFENDVDLVIERARAAGARALVCIGESPEAAARAEKLSLRYPGLVWFTCGVHPHDAATWDDEKHPGVIRLASAAGAVAVGECGLDYHYDHAPREIQRHALNAQVALAAELNRPVVLHTREAEADTSAMLKDAASAGVRGVLHCYTGTRDLAEQALAVGWYVSFSGIITFRNWVDEELLRCVPDDRLLVESDAPYLAPVPNRGKRNESSWVPRTIARLALARETDVESLAALTLHNTRAFFGLPA